MAEFLRSEAGVLGQRLQEPRRFLQVVAGPRQVGKTTLVQQCVERSGLPFHWATGDDQGQRDSTWIEQHWEAARALATKQRAVLVIDEVQKATNWPEAVKRLWDEDSRKRRKLLVVLLGSAPLRIQQGLTESLAGRFEALNMRQWSFAEMAAAFDFSLDEYVFYGGYPGAAPLRGDGKRWQSYVRDSLVEATISRDVLQLVRVDKPALLRRVFELACLYSARELSFNKMLGQLQDAGNTVTVAHYVQLLDAAGMVAGLTKYAGDAARRRASSPKFQVHDQGLMTALEGLPFGTVRKDPEAWGRIVESAVGSHLLHAAARGECELHYWRDGDHEVDFVLRAGRRIVGIEVKSGRRRDVLPGLAAFAAAHKVHKKLLVGSDGIPLGDFLRRPVVQWISD
ncbi:MAG: ATP-binding protein [Planctomycetes bacterium]|nr:ATP-binding protein [Planctomycetota bacterium]MCC7397870.1 ATP-binding protein [Planctomycetota bacterium]